MKINRRQGVFTLPPVKLQSLRSSRGFNFLVIDTSISAGKKAAYVQTRTTIEGGLPTDVISDM